MVARKEWDDIKAGRIAIKIRVADSEDSDSGAEESEEDAEEDLGPIDPGPELIDNSMVINSWIRLTHSQLKLCRSWLSFIIQKLMIPSTFGLRCQFPWISAIIP